MTKSKKKNCKRLLQHFRNLYEDEKIEKISYAKNRNKYMSNEEWRKK